MHQAAAAALGLELVYLPLAVRPERLAAAVAGLAALGFRGVNVTIPHKEAVLPLLDRIDEAAGIIGAINTIVFQAEDDAVHSIGYNTDWSGFLADVDRHLGLAGHSLVNERCLVLGAGGSARAVAYALASRQAEVHLFARRPVQAQHIADGLASHFPAAGLVVHTWDDLADIVIAGPSPRLIVNTTPLGMTPYESQSPWPPGLDWPAGTLVYDLVYNPAQTRFLAQAQAAGCQVTNGLGMLVHQGAQAFSLWTSREPDTKLMAAALRQDQF
jgi:shikimate dehydrogenase